MDKKKLITNIIPILFYSIFTLFIVLHHEIWADEAQVWLICKHLNVFELFKHLVNEGHPSFFYLLVMPFAKLLHGANAILSMQLICWASSCAAVFLLWQFSPFNKWGKTAITLSAGFLYFFPVIARSYSIIPLVIFLIAVLYPKRFEKPILYGILIAVCANIHVIMFGFCTALMLLFFIDGILKKKIFKDTELPQTKTLAMAPVYTALGIMFFSLLAVVLQLHSTTSSNVFITYNNTNFIEIIKKLFAQFFYNNISSKFEYIFDYPTKLILSKYWLIILFESIIYVLLWITLFLNNKKMFFAALSGIIFQFLVYMLSYNYYFFVNRIFIAHIILIFALWVALNEKDKDSTNKLASTKSTCIAICLFFALTIPNGVHSCLLDLYSNYSSAQETAEFINKNIDSNNSIIMTDNPLHCTTIVAFLNRDTKLWSTILNKNIKFTLWNKDTTKAFFPYQWNTYIKSIRDEGIKKKIYIVIPNMHDFLNIMNHTPKTKLIFTSKPCIFAREQYRIYEYTD